MSNIFQGIFGGSKKQEQSQQSSNNQAYPYLQQAYSGQVGTGTQANSLLGSLLGVPGSDPSAGASGLNNYANSAGGQFTLSQGSKAITGNNAARGLLQSGATGQALENFGQQNAQQYVQPYIQNLLGLSGAGTAAGGLIGSAGQQSQGTSSGSASEKPGISKFLGSMIGSAAASDPRLKQDIVKIAEAANGLGVYHFRYNWDAEDVSRTGYMADEVAAIAPYALGPELPGGFMSVRYDLLPPIVEGN